MSGASEGGEGAFIITALPLFGVDLVPKGEAGCAVPLWFYPEEEYLWTKRERPRGGKAISSSIRERPTRLQPGQ